MKASCIYVAVMAAPAVMAAAMGAQAAAMGAMMNEASQLQSLITANCPDLPMNCTTTLETLLGSLMIGASSKNATAIQSGAMNFTSAVKSNPSCAKPIVECIQAVKMAVAAATPTPSASGSMATSGTMATPTPTPAAM